MHEHELQPQMDEQAMDAGSATAPLAVETPLEPVEADPAPAEEASEERAVAAEREAGARPAQPVRRSWGRVKRIEEDGSAWLADFRPMAREVLVRLKTAYQANPGHVLEYELKPAGPGRWSGIDVTFNRPPDLAGVLALDDGRGLSAEGLEFVKRAIVADPAVLREVFRTPRVGRQLLEETSFPLPRALVKAALQVPALASAAARRLQAGGPRDAQEWVALVLGAKPREEEALLALLLNEHPEWLELPLPLPVEERTTRVLRWWKRTGDPRWLRQLAGPDLPEAAGLPLLRAGLLGE